MLVVSYKHFFSNKLVLNRATHYILNRLSGITIWSHIICYIKAQFTLANFVRAQDIALATLGGATLIGLHLFV
jgi:hypothetical protein